MFFGVWVSLAEVLTEELNAVLVEELDICTFGVVFDFRFLLVSLIFRNDENGVSMRIEHYLDLGGLSIELL